LKLAPYDIDRERDLKLVNGKQEASLHHRLKTIISAGLLAFRLQSYAKSPSA